MPTCIRIKCSGYEIFKCRTFFAFNKVFGGKDSKPRLISFLNSVIEFNNGCLITDLDIADPHEMPQLPGMRFSFFDVKAVINDNTTVIIAINVLHHEGFEKHELYNAVKEHSIPLNINKKYRTLKPAIALNIVNFNMFDDNDDSINNYRVMNKKDFNTYNDHIELIFIELNKFTKSQAQCQNIQDNWLFFLKNVEDLTMIPKDLPDIVKSAYEVLNEADMTEEELERQYKNKEWISIQISALSLAEKKGKARAKARGKAKGIEFVALNLLRANTMPEQEIAQMTGLSLAQIAALKAKIIE